MSESLLPSTFRLAANVAHEQFEDEHIVVNLESGKYYALRAEGGDIWALVMAGLDGDTIAAQIASAYSGPVADIAASVSSFLDRLIEEALLVPVPGAAAASTAAALAPRHRAFATPSFELHNDLQDLLLLDPIHEVDPAGWPVLRKDQSDDQR